MQRILFITPMLLALCIAAVALWPDDDLPPIKVGILHSLTGTMAISEKPVVEATLLAIEQLNAQGGLLGRHIEVFVADGASNSATFAKEAERLISEEKVSVVFGCWTSASRKTVKPIFEAHNHLLFYPVQYEGLEQSPNIIYTGATPNQQIFPAVAWSIKNFGERIYLVGSDYVFPRVANWLIHKQVALLNGTIVGEAYLPLGNMDVQHIIQDIQQQQPNIIINTINGDSNIAFFHALREAGLHAKQMPVISMSIGEAELQQMQHPANTTGHYAAWSYFQSLDTPVNSKFVAAYQARFGQDKAISDPMATAWSSVHLWAEAVLSAHTHSTAAVRQTILHQALLAPEGIVAIDEHTQHTWKTSRIGKISNHGQFDIVWTSPTPIRPDPYPSLVSKAEAENFLTQLYQGWGHHWALPLSATTPELGHGDH